MAALSGHMQGHCAVWSALVRVRSLTQENTWYGTGNSGAGYNSDRFKESSTKIGKRETSIPWYINSGPRLGRYLQVVVGVIVVSHIRHALVLKNIHRGP